MLRINLESRGQYFLIANNIKNVGKLYITLQQTNTLCFRWLEWCYIFWDYFSNTIFVYNLLGNFLTDFILKSV